MECGRAASLRSYEIWIYRNGLRRRGRRRKSPGARSRSSRRRARSSEGRTPFAGCSPRRHKQILAETRPVGRRARKRGPLSLRPAGICRARKRGPFRRPLSSANAHLTAQLKEFYKKRRATTLEYRLKHVITTTHLQHLEILPMTENRVRISQSQAGDSIDHSRNFQEII